MGRPKGSKDRVPRDPAACRANAKKPRLRLTNELREVATEKLVPLLQGAGSDRIAAYLTDPKTGFDEFRWAVEFVANRLGLPAMTQQDVNVTGAGREVWVVGEGLGWPEATGATVEPSSDHDDRSDQPSVQ